MEQGYIFRIEWLDNKEIEEIIEMFARYEITSILRLKLSGNLVIKINKDIPFEEYLSIISHKEFITDFSKKEIEETTDVTYKYIDKYMSNQETQDTFINQDGDIDSIENYKSNKKKFKKKDYDYDLPF